jgi:hypothetical protein
LEHRRSTGLHHSSLPHIHSKIPKHISKISICLTYLDQDPEMVTTRGQAVDERIDLVNRTLHVNWSRQSAPTNEDEFEQWMEATKKALLKWLRESRSAAQNEESRRQVIEFNRSAKAEWKKYKALTDVQTGDIHNKGDQDSMEKAMASVKKRRVALHESLGTWHKYVEYRHAQQAWEDFLYYQNVWNRKGDGFKDRYFETAAERRAAEHAKNSGGGKQGANRFELVYTISGTPGSNDMKRTHLAQNAYEKAYDTWYPEMIKVFKTFRLGYRKQIPAMLDPKTAHRYTKPPRGTTPDHLLRYRKRIRHLEERFPRRKRKEIDQMEIEEARRRRHERQIDNAQARKGHMEPIHWSIDNDQFQDVWIAQESAERTTVNKEKVPSFALDKRTKRLLPRDHQLHHGCEETSFDWPTSFESASWGDTLSKTGIRSNVKVYEEVTDEYDEDTDESVNKKKRKRKQYKHDKSGNKILALSRGRYKMHIVKKPGDVFVCDTDKDSTVLGRDREGSWNGRWTKGEVEEREFELDADGERIPEPEKQILRRVYTTTVISPEEPGVTRRGRHGEVDDNGEDKMDQLSEDEGIDVDKARKTSTNYKLSGNENPAQVGNPTVWSDEDDDVDSDGSRSEEEESDDEGDLFKQSYEECSGRGKCPKQRARELHERLVAEIGILSWWDESKTLAFCKKKTDKAIWEQYALLMHEKNRSSP